MRRRLYLLAVIAAVLATTTAVVYGATAGEWSTPSPAATIYPYTTDPYHPVPSPTVSPR